MTCGTCGRVEFLCACPPPVDLPASYSHPDTVTRVRRGLQATGHDHDTADRAARLALAEAPFASPTVEGWRIACARARQLAAEGLPHQYPRLGPDGLLWRAA